VCVCVYVLVRWLWLQTWGGSAGCVESVVVMSCSVRSWRLALDPKERQCERRISGSDNRHAQRTYDFLEVSDVANTNKGS
jgi:hypothetical protein